MIFPSLADLYWCERKWYLHHIHDRDYLDLRLIFFLYERDGHFFLHADCRTIRSYVSNRSHDSSREYILASITRIWRDSVFNVFPLTYDRYSSMKYIINTPRPSRAFETLAPATPHRPGGLYDYAWIIRWIFDKSNFETRYSAFEFYV